MAKLLVILCVAVCSGEIRALEDPDLIRNFGDAKALALGLPPSKGYASAPHHTSYSSGYESSHNYAPVQLVAPVVHAYASPASYHTVNLKTLPQNYAVTEGLSGYSARSSIHGIKTASVTKLAPVVSGYSSSNSGGYSYEAPAVKLLEPVKVAAPTISYVTPGVQTYKAAEIKVAQPAIPDRGYLPSYKNGYSSSSGYSGASFSSGGSYSHISAPVVTKVQTVKYQAPTVTYSSGYSGNSYGQSKYVSHAPASSYAQYSAPQITTHLAAPVAQVAQVSHYQAPAAAQVSHYQAPVAHVTHYQAPAIKISHLQAPVAQISHYQAPAAQVSHYQAPAAHYQSSQVSHYQAPAAQATHYQAPAAQISHYQAPAAQISHYQAPAAQISHYQAPLAQISHYQAPVAQVSHYQAPVAQVSHAAQVTHVSHVAPITHSAPVTQVSHVSAPVATHGSTPVATHAAQSGHGTATSHASYKILPSGTPSDSSHHHHHHADAEQGKYYVSAEN